MNIAVPGVILVSWLGILAGFMLGNAAQEEVAHAKKWLIWLQRLMWLCIATTLAAFFRFDATATILVAILCVAIILFEHQIPEQIRHLLLGISIILGANNNSFLTILGSSIFIYFLLCGISVIPAQLRRKDKTHAIQHVGNVNRTNKVRSQSNKINLAIKKLVGTAAYPFIALLLFIFTLLLKP